MSNSTALLSEIKEYADTHYDGMFTILKYRNTWCVCYGIFEDSPILANMHSGETLEDALQKLLEDPIDATGMNYSEHPYDFHGFEDLYAIKINKKHWLPNHHKNEHVQGENIQTFTTEKKALNEIKYLQKHEQFSNLDLKVMKVEVETFIHLKQGIHKQTIREL